MSEQLEKMFLVSKHTPSKTTPQFVFDNRIDARHYATRMNVKSRFDVKYKVSPVKRGPISRKRVDAEGPPFA